MHNVTQSLERMDQIAVEMEATRTHVLRVGQAVRDHSYKTRACSINKWVQKSKAVFLRRLKDVGNGTYEAIAGL